MSRLPALKGKGPVRFSNPLAGHVYDNTKYQYSCFFEKDEENQWQQLSSNLKSKSVMSFSLKKDMKISNQSNFNKEANSTSLLNKHKINIFEVRWLNPVKKCSKHCRKISETYNPQKSFSIQQGRTTEKIADKYKYKSMKFAEIEVKVLQSVQKDKVYLAQYNQKQFQVHLGRYFELFFKSKLQGVLFEQLGMFVQSKIEQIISWEEKTHTKEVNEQNQNIKSKRVLYQKLLQLDRIGNEEMLKQLLLYFCIPPFQTRQIFLNDLMSLISHKLYDRFNFNKNEKYVLLTQKGKVIKDFGEIKFSTKRLYVAQENQLERLLDQHFNQIKAKKNIRQKSSFNQTLKDHFRNQLTKGLYQQNLNLQKSFSEQKSQKKLNLDKAEKIISLKYQKHTQGRKRIRRLMQISKRKNDSNPSQKIQKEGKQVNKFDKNILTTNQRIMAEFKKLKTLNDYQNAQFKNNENNKNNIQFRIIARESPYFKNKSQIQVQRIFQSLPFISSNKISSYQKQTITDEQYMELRKIIACLADRQSIILFIDRYLCFDQYGELQKQRLKQTLLFVIGETKTCQVIMLTIWSWLQKNGVIVNDSLNRANMQHLYQRNKTVYYFLISLIFGTNQTTALDLAEDIL